MAASLRANAMCIGMARLRRRRSACPLRKPVSTRRPYDIENVSIDSYELHQPPPAGALRGFGVPQLVWAYESHTV